VCKNDVMISIL